MIRDGARQSNVASSFMKLRLAFHVVRSSASSCLKTVSFFCATRSASIAFTMSPLSQVLLGIQRQLQQALEELILGNADEVLEHQLLGEQPADVAQLQHLLRAA